MNKSFKKILAVTLGLTIGASLFAQMASDPNHNFYKDAQKWETFGVVTNLPPVRPYPVRIIKNILKSVIENGTEIQSSKAQEYYEELTGRPFHLQMEIDGDYKNASGSNSFGVAAFPEVSGDASLLNDWVGISYKVGFSGYTKNAVDYEKEYLPYGKILSHDTRQDPGMLGPFNFYFDTNDSFSIGNDNYFFQIGLNRMGYGRFIGEGLALNENAYHSGNMVLTIFQDRWNYVQLYSALGASKAYDGTSLQSNKYLAFHQFEFKFTPNISLSYYENIIFGRRFDFSYLIPAPYMAVQGLGGCDDNLQMGLMFNFKPIKGLLWSTDLFVDDVSFNELVKFNFDTKIRVAAQTGLIYSPEDSIFSNIALRYTLTTPYTYSHWDYTDLAKKTIDRYTYNFQNYTNNGVPIGSSLAPNSDNIKVSFDLNPIKNLNLSFNFGFTRHGNSAETLPVDEAIKYLLADSDVYATDGSINHHTIYSENKGDSEYLSSAWNKLNFLNQAHKMYIFQGGFDAEYTIGKYNWGSVSLAGGYTGEYIINKGVDSNMFPGGLVTANGDGTYNYAGANYTADTLVNTFKTNWANALSNQFNNYLHFEVRYRW